MAECRTLIQGTRLRATRIGADGAPVAGLASTVTSGFISVAMTDNVESGDEFKQKNADGTYCINQRSLPLLNWIETTITLCQVHPELFELTSGSPLVMDDATPTPGAVGFGTDETTYASASFALELWTNVGRGGAVRYGYLLLPWLIEGTIGDISIENAAVNFTINTITSGGNAWGTGPYNVIKTRTGVSSKLLTAIPTNRHRHIQYTSLAPPAAVCGYQTLVLTS